MIGKESHIAVGDDTDEMSFAVADRYTGDFVFGHESFSLIYVVVGGKEERVDDNAVFASLYSEHLIDLLLDGHILMTATNSAFASHSDGKVRLGYGVHSRGHKRNIELDFVCELGVQIYIFGKQIAFCRYEEYVIKSETLVQKLFVCVNVYHMQFPSTFLRCTIIYY